MSKQYFYRDPLAAAWQAKHFGMRFVGLANDPTDMSDYFFESQTGAVVPCGRTYIVHPDSLPLLEPMELDIVAVKNVNCPGWSTGVIESGCKTMTLDGESGGGWNYSGDRIIQRNGIPFMWPEQTETKKDTTHGE